MTRLGLLVTDTSPLIILAATDALDCLTMPGVPVIVPDMVYFEVTQDLAPAGAVNVDLLRRVVLNQLVTSIRVPPPAEPRRHSWRLCWFVAEQAHGQPQK